MKNVLKCELKTANCISMKKTIRIGNFHGLEIGKSLLDLEVKKFSEDMRKLLKDEDVSLEKMYQTVEDLTQALRRRELYKILDQALEEYLKEKLKELCEQDSPEKFFDSLVETWDFYSKKSIIIRNVYLLCDRAVTNEFKFNTVHYNCKNTFLNVIVLNDIVSDRIRSQLLDIIARERQADLFVRRDQLGRVVSILVDLCQVTRHVYRLIFENHFLKMSEIYFEREAKNIAEKKMDVKNYLFYVVKKIRDEEGRVYLQSETIKKVLAILNKHMVENHLREILKEGFQELMDNNALLYLKTMYKLLSQVTNGVKTLSEYFTKYVEDVCTKIVINSNNKSMIQELINFKDRLDEMIDNCFLQNKYFSDNVKLVFKKIINIKNNVSALYLAKYLDSKLRSKNINEDQFEATLNKIMMIFRLIQGKDIVEAFYRQDLAKRLIFARLTNQDIENNVISRLKKECGDEFTTKIEGMMKDMNLSKTINRNFKEYVANTQGNWESWDISILVLTTGFWTKPIENPSVILPDTLLNYQASFSKYYNSIHTGRKLDWQPHLGNCIVRATFNSSIKELAISLYQTIVLLLFNEHDKLTTMEIQNLTKLDMKDLLATLHSLACGKFQILNKQPENNVVQKEDVFQFNGNFTDKLFRIKIAQAQFKEPLEEMQEMEKQVFADRQYQIDAAIVRIMKQKKVLTHNGLLAQLFKALDIPMKQQDLKKRIDHLIEKEYITRDRKGLYTYVA